jgi:hypothetical protein
LPPQWRDPCISHFAVVVAFAFAVACSLPTHHKKTSSRPKAAHLPPQRRDPCIPPLSLYFALAAAYS